MHTTPDSRHALIGATGLVGSNLLRQTSFTHLFRSTNIDTIRGQHFSTIICAGVNAVKWRANQQPEADWEGIKKLLSPLETVTAGHFCLISSADVYEPPTEADELTPPSARQPYGRHRAMVEEFVARHFRSHSILRLPALFGNGLKKNALFDLMHHHRTEYIHPGSTFQWYPLTRLWEDINLIREQRLSVVNLVTEPITMHEIQARFFPHVPIGAEAGAAVHYNLKTRHDGLFGGQGGYISSAGQILKTMSAFLEESSR